MVLLPGATLGIIGDGMTAQYMAQLARDRGYLVAMFSLDADTPVLKSGDYQFVGLDEFASFASLVDRMIYTDVGVPDEILGSLSDHPKMIQGTTLLNVTDDLAISRTLLESLSLNILPYVIGVTLDDVVQATEELGYPVIVKPLYHKQTDKKGIAIHGAWELGEVAPLIDGTPVVIETYLEAVQEFTVTGVRSPEGETALYPILQTEQAPTTGLRRAWALNLNHLNEVAAEMLLLTEKVGQQLGHVGSFTLNFYFSREGNLYVKNILAGLPMTNQIYRVLTNVAVEDQVLRTLVGQPLVPVTPRHEAGIYLPLTAADQPQLSVQWGIQPQWEFYTYATGSQRKPQVGHILAHGDNMTALWQQVQASGLWSDLAEQE